MSAKYHVEEFLADQINLHLPELGVPAIPGSSTGRRPDEFVTVNCPDEDAAGDGAWQVSCEVISVVPLDDDDADTASRRRLELLSTFFGRACPLRRAGRPGVFIAGLEVLKTYRVTKTRSRGEVLPMTVFATVPG